MDAGSKFLKLTSILLLTSHYIVHCISFLFNMINYTLHITNCMVYLDSLLKKLLTYLLKILTNEIDPEKRTV